MTGNFRLEEHHNTFGGLISESDYNGYNSLSDIARKIISDWSFDEQCRKNIEITRSKAVNR